MGKFTAQVGPLPLDPMARSKAPSANGPACPKLVA